MLSSIIFLKSIKGCVLWGGCAGILCARFPKEGQPCCRCGRSFHLSTSLWRCREPRFAVTADFALSCKLSFPILPPVDKLPAWLAIFRFPPPCLSIRLATCHCPYATLATCQFATLPVVKCSLPARLPPSLPLHPIFAIRLRLARTGCRRFFLLLYTLGLPAHKKPIRGDYGGLASKWTGCLLEA